MASYLKFVDQLELPDDRNGDDPVEELGGVVQDRCESVVRHPHPEQPTGRVLSELLLCFARLPSASQRQRNCMSRKYNGIPTVMLNGKVTPSAMGIYRPGSALGAAKRMAAGTAM